MERKYNPLKLWLMERLFPRESEYKVKEGYMRGLYMGRTEQANKLIFWGSKINEEIKGIQESLDKLETLRLINEAENILREKKGGLNGR